MAYFFNIFIPNFIIYKKLFNNEIVENESSEYLMQNIGKHNNLDSIEKNGASIPNQFINSKFYLNDFKGQLNNKNKLKKTNSLS